MANFDDDERNKDNRRVGRQRPKGSPGELSDEMENRQENRGCTNFPLQHGKSEANPRVHNTRRKKRTVAEKAPQESQGMARRNGTVPRPMTVITEGIETTMNWT